MKMIKLHEDLPELVEFTLSNGEKMNVRHLGNRLEITLLGGRYHMLVSPQSGNMVTLIPATDDVVSELSKPLKQE
jgi:hypothetical protein